MNAWNNRLIERFRCYAGWVGGNFDGVPLLILHTVGARSGQARENPLVFRRSGQAYAVFASAGGAHRHPDWYHNLLARPHAVVEVGDRLIEVTARVASGSERDELWHGLVRAIPAFAQQQRATSRMIPVVVLEPAP
ncbi:MAG TPA: nitroreductase family deazaflavin-dependent oxidoreductase [Actinomycetota bacterium]|nr:nitroreductase family deazaflavin-dependent oxidoreductase [Actinomycetota bacterium]